MIKKITEYLPHERLMMAYAPYKDSNRVFIMFADRNNKMLYFDEGTSWKVVKKHINTVLLAN